MSSELLNYMLSPKRTLLNQAAHDGDMKLLEEQIALLAHANAFYELGIALFVAVRVQNKNYEDRIKNSAVIAALLHAGATTSFELQWDRDRSPQTLTTQAAINNNPAAIRSLCAAGVNIDKPNSRQETPLITICHTLKKDIPTIAALLDCGANINANDKYGQSPLSCAVLSDDIEGIKYLLSRGADANSLDNEGDTALMGVFRLCMLKTVADTIEIAKALLRSGAGKSINNRNNADMTVLGTFMRSDYLMQNATTEEKTKLVNLLLSDGANPDNRDKSGNTDLMYAIKSGEMIYLDALLAAGANPNARNRQGVTPLIYAVSCNDSRMVSALLKAGVNLNDCDINGNTALIIAAFNKSQDILKLLLEAGADLKLKNNAGDTALQVAAKQGNKSCTETLEAYAHSRRKEAFQHFIGRLFTPDHHVNASTTTRAQASLPAPRK